MLLENAACLRVRIVRILIENPSCNRIRRGDQRTKHPNKTNDSDCAREAARELFGVHGLADVEPALKRKREYSNNRGYRRRFENKRSKDAKSLTERPRIGHSENAIELGRQA